MSNEFLFGIGMALWCIGWVCQVADISAGIDAKNIKEPFNGAFLLVWVLMLFTWPYWYFYGKSSRKYKGQ